MSDKNKNLQQILKPTGIFTLAPSNEISVQNYQDLFITSRVNYKLSDEEQKKKKQNIQSANKNMYIQNEGQFINNQIQREKLYQMTTFMSSDQQINNTNTLYISQLIAKNDKKQTRATLFQSNIQHEQTQKSQQHKQQTQKLKPLHLELSQTQRINTILTIGQVSYEEEVVATPKYKKSQKSRMQKLQQFQQNMNQILDDLDDRIVQLTIEIQ